MAAMAADGLPVEKLSIYGPTLASLLHRFSSSPGDANGLLFGHISLLPPAEPSDDDPSPSAASGPSLAAAITGFLSFTSPHSFSDPLGRVASSLLRRAPADGSVLLGWFSARRRSPLRPSMRELAVSVSLAQTLTLEINGQGSSDRPQIPPRIFLLLSLPPAPNQAVHTHEYRAFVLRPKASVLEPRSLHVVNVGPAFRGQYGSFSPELGFPWVPCPRGRSEGEGTSEANGVPRLEASAGDDQLGRLVGPGAAEYTSELEGVYGKMLLKLENLARMVEKSSVMVLEQENQNLLLRTKLAGLE